MTAVPNDQPTGYDELLQVLADLPVIVRETRRRKQQSFREAARESGVDAATLNRTEHGKGDPSLKNIRGILRWSS